MALVSIFKIDEFGYPRFTNAGWTDRAAAERVQSNYDVPTEILTYGEFKARQDTDDMGEAERRRKLGLDVAPAVEKRGVVITGTVDGMSRAAVKAFIQVEGYVPQASVNSKTALLVVGANAGRSKIKAAEQLGVKIITWSEFGA